MDNPIVATQQERLRREAVVRDIANKRVEFVERGLKIPGLHYNRCFKCGRRYWGISCIADMSFMCLLCLAEERYPEPADDGEDIRPSPTPKLDLDDFARI